MSDNINQKWKEITDSDYRTTEDKKYFGSDLNKWINKNCRRDMTVNNIDLIIYRHGNGVVRVIESKHEKEMLGNGQFKLLTILAKIANVYNKLMLEYQLEVYIIKGNYPYDNVEITNMSTETTKNIDAFMLKDFIDFKIDFSEL